LTVRPSRWAFAHILVHNCFTSKDVITMTRAFVVYVRPLLEYTSSVWSPYLLKDIKRVESVQRRFTKRLCGMSNLSYASRLKGDMQRFLPSELC